MSEEALPIAEERREVKSKGERERNTQLNPENNKERQEGHLQRRMPKKKRKTTERVRLEISSRKLEISKEHLVQRWAQ